MQFSYHQVMDYNGRALSQRPGGKLAYACDANAQPTTGTPSAAATQAVGPHFNNLTVVATDNGFIGYRVG